MRVRTLTREKLEKRLEVAENALWDARALLAAWDKVYSQEEIDGDTQEAKIKREYFKERSVRTVAEWALENMPGFEASKAGAMARVKDIILEQTCGDADLDRAARAIFYENSAAAAKYGYGN